VWHNLTTRKGPAVVKVMSLNQEEVVAEEEAAKEM
jgi:hypothetical protein